MNSTSKRGIRGAINSQAKYGQSQIYQFTTGTITYYDCKMNTVTVEYDDTSSGGKIIKTNIPISSISGGIHPGSFETGQLVYLNFIAGNPNTPVIVGVDTNHYFDRDNYDQGAYIPNDDVYNVGTNEHLISQDIGWLDINNDSLNKYNNAVSRYKDADVDKETHNLLVGLNHYSESEVGLTHLNKHSTIRLRDNGDIDVFTAYNTGMRITETGLIKFYCKDIKFTDDTNDMDNIDRSLTSRLRASHASIIDLTYDDIKHIEDTIETMYRIVNLEHVINYDNTSNAGKWQQTQGKIDSYKVISSEFVNLPMDSELVATYVRKINDYRYEFDEILYSMIDKRFEIESGFITPCTGYIEIEQPAEKSYGYIATTMGPRLYSIKNYEYEFTINQTEEEKLTDFDDHDTRYKLKETQDSNLHYTNLLEADVASDGTLESWSTNRLDLKTYRYMLDHLSDSEQYKRVNPESINSKNIYIPVEDTSLKPSIKVSKEDDIVTKVTTTSDKIITETSQKLKYDKVTGQDTVLNTLSYIDTVTDIDVNRVYYEYTQSQWVLKHKEIECKGENVRFYFYPTIE